MLEIHSPLHGLRGEHHLLHLPQVAVLQPPRMNPRRRYSICDCLALKRSNYRSPLGLLIRRLHHRAVPLQHQCFRKSQHLQSQYSHHLQRHLQHQSKKQSRQCSQRKAVLTHCLRQRFRSKPLGMCNLRPVQQRQLQKGLYRSPRQLRLRGLAHPQYLRQPRLMRHRGPHRLVQSSTRTQAKYRRHGHFWNGRHSILLLQSKVPRPTTLQPARLTRQTRIYHRKPLLSSRSRN